MGENTQDPGDTEVNGEKGNRCVRVMNEERKSAGQITARRIMRPWDKDNKVLSDDLPTVDLRSRLC